MPKKIKQEQSSEEEESYDVEDDSQENDDNDVEQYSQEDSDGEMREVNREHLLNYESDSSQGDDMDDDSDDFGKGLQKQKEELIMNDTWGSKKRNFYGRDKKADDVSSSEDDEDEYQEALRLQKVRAKKLQQQLAEDKQLEQEDVQEIGSISDEESESSDDDNENKKKHKKLGDRLFADDNGNKDNENGMISAMKQVDPKVLKQIIDKESPELRGLLEEFESSLYTLNKVLKPLLENKEVMKKHINKQIQTYVEMKHNLLLSYCTYLSYYLLLKIESKPIKDHPVIFKLANLKTLLDQLIPLDSKLEPSLIKIMKTKKNGKAKPTINKQDISDDEGDDEIEDYGEEDESEVENKKDLKKNKQKKYQEEISEDEEMMSGDDEDIEQDDDQAMEEDEEVILTKKQIKTIKKRENQELQNKLQTIDDLDDIDGIVQKASKKKKKVKVEDNKPNNNQKDNHKHNNNDNNPSKISFNDLKATPNVKGDDLYEAQKQKLKEKKQQKQILNQERKKEVEKGIEKMDQNIQRNINYVIEKSKGLTRKRKKIDRNPRVKHREKYRKAIIKRKSKVQEFKEGPQGKYGGEASGLRANLIKSTKLT